MTLEEKQSDCRARHVQKWNPEYNIIRKERRHKNALTYKYVMVASAKSRAKQNGLPFDLAPEDITIPEFCPILGIRIRKGTNYPCLSSPSLDRITPANGYVKGNVRVISQRANGLRSNATLQELLLLADDALRMHGLRWEETERLRLYSLDKNTENG